MINSQAVDGRSLLIYLWGHSSKDPYPPSCITKFKEVFSCMATYFNLVPCKGFV